MPVYILILSFSIVCLYAGTLFSPFLYDDMHFIVYNPAIRHLSDIGAIWHAQVLPVRFVAYLTFALNYHVHQLHTFGYHLVNVGIHIVNSCLVLWFVRLLFRSPRLKGCPKAAQASHIAFAAALLFAIHPMQTQAVSYITQRFASLAALFYLASVCFYMKARCCNGHRPAAFGYYAGAVCAAVLSMFTKENAMTLPLNILWIELFLFNTVSLRLLLRSKTFWLRTLCVMSFLILVPWLYKFDLASKIFIDSASASHQGDWLSPGGYLLTQFRIVTRYIHLLFIPVGQNLLYDYPMSKSLFEWTTMLSLMFLSGLLMGGVFLRKRMPLVTFGVGWFFIALSLESSFIPIRHIIFEHRVYLPSVGFFIAVAVGCAYIWPDRKKYLIGLLCIATVYGLATVQRNKVWKDDIRLWEDVRRKSPMDARPLNNLGLAYVTRGNLETALEYFNEGLKLNGRDAFLYNNRGHVRRLLGQDEAALNDFSTAVQLRNNFDEAYNNRGLVYKAQKKFDLALADFNQAVAFNPRNADAYSNRGLVYQALGNYESALSDYNKALTYNPHFVQAINNRGNVYRVLNRFEDALKEYDRALALDPVYVLAWNNQAIVYDRLGRVEEALVSISKAIVLDPDYVDALHNRGNIYLKEGQYVLAVKDYSRVIHLDPDRVVAYVNRAAAYRVLNDAALALSDLRFAQDLGWAVDQAVVNQVSEIVEGRQ